MSLFGVVYPSALCVYHTVSQVVCVLLLSSILQPCLYCGVSYCKPCPFTARYVVSRVPSPTRHVVYPTVIHVFTQVVSTVSHVLSPTRYVVHPTVSGGVVYPCLFQHVMWCGVAGGVSYCNDHVHVFSKQSRVLCGVSYCILLLAKPCPFSNTLCGVPTVSHFYYSSRLCGVSYCKPSCPFSSTLCGVSYC